MYVRAVFFCEQIFVTLLPFGVLVIFDMLPRTGCGTKYMLQSPDKPRMEDLP